MTRELDVLVAEKVLGWVRCHHPDEPEAWISGPKWREAIEGGDRRLVREGVALGDGGKPLRDPAHDPAIPYFSSDVAAAFLVVEAMRERGWHLDLQDHELSYDHEPWWAKFTPAVGCHAEAWAETAPLAIVKAALRAVGEN